MIGFPPDVRSRSQHPAPDYLSQPKGCLLFLDKLRRTASLHAQEKPRAGAIQ
jgi:hypothetical protein